MSLSLTPERLAAIYRCLRVFPPFNRWQLPPAHEVAFRAAQRKDCQAEHQPYTDGSHSIMISTATVGHFNRAVVAMAHEMVHVAQDVSKTATPAQHNADFMKRWGLVAKRFGWDPKEI